MYVQSDVSLVFLAPATNASRAHQSGMLRWLAHLGTVGLFVVAAIDSSVIPMPIPGTTDLLMLWLVSHRGNPWMLVPFAIAGSLVGGYTTWHLGKRGGEAALRRYVPERLLNRTHRWVQGHPVLSVFLPAILPPPIPLSPFLLAAGALKVSLKRFLPVFGAARTLRYSFVAWLAVRYGRRVIRLWSGTLEKWSTPIIWTFVILMVAGVCYGIWKFKRQSAQTPSEPALEASAGHGD
jgi:membrane protein YqaA with SNARE-associated domain